MLLNAIIFFQFLNIYIHVCYGENHPQTNFLFMMFDDLRPEIFSYGRKHMITPNIDRLASKSVSFDRCFNQIAVCNPSRDSLLTGLRPDTNTHSLHICCYLRS